MRFLSHLLVIAAFLAAIGTATAGTVNINKADVEALQENLPGIGPVKAKAIVDYRKKNGPFKNVDDLKQVPGIGDKLLSKIRKDASLSKGATSASKDFKPDAKKSVSDSSKKADSKPAKDTTKTAKTKTTKADDKTKAKKPSGSVQSKSTETGKTK
ncbi:MAG: helix-hairpin-helix domain-containing protein [Chromatiales bacterium]|nr:helix-hairpin-helix domain-containing protein [Chromatiales bacterium]